MLILIIFSSFIVEGDYYLEVRHSSGFINLSFHDPGFTNPALGSGIIGAGENPATLGYPSRFEIFGGFTGPVEGTYNFSESFNIDAVDDSINIPFDIIYNDPGGFDFIGISRSFGPFGLGISYSKGYTWGLEFGMNGNIHGVFHPDEPFQFTHSDYSEIPEGDTIRFRLPLSGGIRIQTPDPVNVRYSTSPIFMGGGFDFGSFKLGCGVKFSRNKLQGSGNFLIIPDTFSIVVDTVVSDGVDDWEIDSLVGNFIIRDTVVSGSFHSLEDEYVTQPSFNLGCIFDLKLLKISLAYEYGSGYSMPGGYEWIFRRVSGIPENYELDTTDFVVNSNANYVGGSVDVTMSELPVDEDRDTELNGMNFSGYNSLKAGLAISMPAMDFGINGGIEFPVSEDYCICRLNSALFTRVPFPVIDVSAGISGSFLWIRGTGNSFEQFEDFYLPALSAGISLGYTGGPVHVGIPVKINFSQIAVDYLSDNFAEKETPFNPFENLNIGIGMRIKI